MRCNASWEWGWDRREKGSVVHCVCSLSFSTKWPYLPLNRPFAAEEQAAWVGGSMGRSPVPHLLLSPKKVAICRLPSVLLALLVCVAPFPALWPFIQSPTSLCGEAPSLPGPQWQTPGPDTGFFTFPLWLHQSLQAAGSGSFNFQR